MSIQVVLATRSAHKTTEVRRILAGCTDEIELLDLTGWPEAPEVVEDGASFAANALLKARSAAAHTGLPAIADDSGICVDALNGMPGILSARWAGSHGNDSANLNLLLDQISQVPDGRRSANFTCVVALVTPTGEERVVEGVVDGEVVRAARGEGGFGYDPVFQPYGFDRTTAELRPEEKDAISHRGQALRSMVPVMLDLLAVKGCCGNCTCGAGSR